MNKPVTVSLHNLFRDHATLMQRDIQQKLRRKTYVIESKMFCISDIGTQKQMIDLINKVQNFFVRKLRFKRYTGLRLEDMQDGNLGQFIFLFGVESAKTVVRAGLHYSRDGNYLCASFVESERKHNEQANSIRNWKRSARRAISAGFKQFAPPSATGPTAPSVAYNEKTLRAINKANPRFPRRQFQHGPFIWETSKGQLIRPSKMATEHLFFTLRMLYNHSMPPCMRVGDWKYRAGVDEWPLDYRIQATSALRAEWNKRDDDDVFMRQQIKDMDANILFYTKIFNLAEETTAGPVQTVIDPAALSRYAKEGVINDEKGRAALRKSERQENAAAQRANRKAARMKKAVKTTLRGFPGKRCMEHRSYAGIRRPRVECHACEQVFRARRANRKNPRLYRKP